METRYNINGNVSDSDGVIVMIRTLLALRLRREEPMKKNMSMSSLDEVGEVKEQGFLV